MMTTVPLRERNDTAFTFSTTTVKLDNSLPASPDLGLDNPIGDEMRRVAKLAEEANLPKFTYACVPSGTQRYSLNCTATVGRSRLVIKPSSIFFPPELTLPKCWERHIHPEGLPYFVLYGLGDSQIQRVVTEEWMYDPKISTLILDFVEQIQDAISDQKLFLLPESDLFLELQRDQGQSIEGQDGHTYCGYYFVHNPSRCIYWPEKVTLNPFTSKTLNSMWRDLTGYQYKLRLEAEYWTHWNHFPSLQSVTPDIYDYVVNTIMCVMTDVTSAPRDASIVFTYQELQKTLELVRMAQDCNTSSWHIGRFMMHLTQDRFRNYDGAWGTRMIRSQSVVKVEYKPHSMIVDIVSPVLFFIPHAQLERVGVIAIDQYIISHQWESFLDEIQGEWHQIALLATITLAANWAFLAISMFLDLTPVSHSSPEQISRYLSLTTSLFGLIFALSFYRHCETWRTNLPGDLFAYVHESDEEDFDYKRFKHLILLWSLPHALVVWSVITFSLAFLSMCIFGTVTPTKVTIGLSTSLLTSSTFYYLVKFGSCSKLFRIWFGRILRTMKRPFHSSDQVWTNVLSP